jgi:hypothetical protein
MMAVRGARSIARFIRARVSPFAPEPVAASRWDSGENARFFVGANLPWITYGLDFGANAWQPTGGLSAHPERLEQLDAACAALAAQDIRLVRWFFLCDGRAGVRLSGGRVPLGLDDSTWRDIDAALVPVQRHGLRLLVVLFDFYWCRPARMVRGVRLGGLRQVIRRPALREALLEHVVSPLLRRYGSHPAILGWDLFNEPEWVTLGLDGWHPRAVVSPQAMRSFLRDAAWRARTLTSQLVTVGLASARGLDLCRGLPLDFYQVHWYDSIEAEAPLERDVAELDVDRPVVLGEFPTRGSRRSTALVLRLAKQAGYRGALLWSVRAHDSASDWAAAQAALTQWRRDPMA